MENEGSTREVVLVHGLWFRGWAMAIMARRLRRAGFTTRSFSYSTTRQELGQQVDRLYRFAASDDGTLPHFVAHSMGGLITLKMLFDHAQSPSGRVVLMGSPVRGSSVAQRVGDWPGGGQLLGSAARTLVEGVRTWPSEREIGMVAGTRQLGLGTLAGGAIDRGDGTVLAVESRHEGLCDYVEIPASHTGMLFSGEAASQAIAFLRRGRFSPGLP